MANQQAMERRTGAAIRCAPLRVSTREDLVFRHGSATLDA